MYNSDYYKTLLVMGVFLALLVILLNMFFIPVYGLNGAALASFMAISIYNTIKLFFVKAKFNIMPFSLETLKVFVILLVMGGVFYMVSLPFHPIINIGLKSVVTIVFYVGILYRFKISEDVHRLLTKYIKK